MASLSFKSNKAGIVQFVAPDGRRVTVYIGKVSRKAGEAFRSHVENLLGVILSGQTLARETAAWVGAIGDGIYAKLAAAGLVTPRAAKVETQLGPFLEKYIKSRTATLKPATIANLNQVRNGLVGHFGKKRSVESINAGEIGDWHRGLQVGKAKATVAMHVKKARQFFADAMSRKLIQENPLAGLKAGSMENRERFVYVPTADIERVIQSCPDAEWRAIFALARYAGLRVPSETNAMRWGDVDWARGRMIVRSAKTEHHHGKASREVPLFPALLTHLQDAFEAAESGQVNIVTLHRGENLRTMAEKIIRRAGLQPWGKLFQNLRSSCETDLTAHFPLHVACAWVGNSEAVAKRHYLQVTDQHFADAIGNRAAESAVDTAGQHRTQSNHKSEKPASERVFAVTTYPQGESNRSGKYRLYPRIPRSALRKALRRLQVASPTLYQAERHRIHATLRKGGGR